MCVINSETHSKTPTHLALAETKNSGKRGLRMGKTWLPFSSIGATHAYRLQHRFPASNSVIASRSGTKVIPPMVLVSEIPMSSRARAALCGRVSQVCAGTWNVYPPTSSPPSASTISASCVPLPPSSWLPQSARFE